MTRNEFMNRLEQLLAALPAAERRDALDYYDEYLDAAGPQREAETLAELGSPEEVARKILEAQPQLPTPADPGRQNTPLPPQRPPRRTSANWALRWAGLGIVVVVLVMYLFQHSTARRVRTAEGTTTTFSGVSTAQELPLDSTQTIETADSAYELPPEALKKLTLDLDTGSVVFEQDANITAPQVSFANKSASATLETTFRSSGSTISYKLSSGPLNAKDSKFKVTITLPAGYQMDKLDASLDMGSLTLGDLSVETLTADLDMGSVTAGTLNCDDADFDLDMGSFTAHALTARKLNVSSDMGSVTIDRLSGSDLELSTEMGSITATLTGRESDYAIDAENDMGKLTIGGNSYKEKYSSRGAAALKLRNSMGSTTLDFAS